MASFLQTHLPSPGVQPPLVSAPSTPLTHPAELHYLRRGVISPPVFQSEGSRGNLAAKRTSSDRTPEDKGKGGSWFHFSMLVTLLAGQGNQALPKLVHQPPALPFPAPVLIQAGWCPRGSCWLLSVSATSSSSKALISFLDNPEMMIIMIPTAV